MVSANPNPPLHVDVAALPDPSAVLLFSPAVPSPEDAGKKARKPYTISKSRESWTDIEHDKFLEALHLFDRDWKKIEVFIGSKTVIQIRSHAQKYFLKIQKNSASEHVPPPRPKRKAAHPYPHKAPKDVIQLSQVPVPLEPSSLFEAGYDLKNKTMSLLPCSTTKMEASRVQGFVHPYGAYILQKDDVGPTGSLVGKDCSCSSIESLGTSRTSEVTDKEENNFSSVPEIPDFAQAYSFLGSVFDPNTTDHMKRLKEMNPIDVETVLLLMRNLSINLTSPEFETHVTHKWSSTPVSGHILPKEQAIDGHFCSTFLLELIYSCPIINNIKRLLLSYGSDSDIGIQETKFVGHDMLQTCEIMRTPFMYVLQKPDRP